MPLKITPMYYSQAGGLYSSIKTPKAGLFKLLCREMLCGSINDSNVTDVDTWKKLLVKAAIDQVVGCQQLFREYTDHHNKIVRPTLNADQLYRHILIATGIDIAQSDIEPMLVGIDHQKTPIFINDASKGDASWFSKMHPTFEKVITDLLGMRVDQTFINQLEGLLSGKIHLFYPEAQAEFQKRPMHAMISHDLVSAAEQSRNSQIHDLLTKTASSFCNLDDNLSCPSMGAI